MFKKYDGRYCVHLAEGPENWGDLTAINFQVPKKMRENFMNTVFIQEGFSIALVYFFIRYISVTHIF